MQTRDRDGVRLAFTDSGSGAHETPVVLLHGWGCDHRSLLRQQEHLQRTHRVLNVDLRGHGESAASAEPYSVAQLADDAAWLGKELGLARAFVVGHSMGGAVALEMAFRHPGFVRALVMIDTVFQPPAALNDVLAPLLPSLPGPDYAKAYRAIMSALSLPSERGTLEAVLATLPAAPQQVLLAALEAHLQGHDFAAAASGCTVPAAYIGAASPLGDVTALKRLIPDLVTGQTVGAGHFSPLLVPAQVNDMLVRFFDLAVR